MTAFHVGQRLFNDYHRDMATVTAITERGFRWRLDHRRSLGPRYGWYQEGESLTDEGWTVAQPSIAQGASGSPSSDLARPDEKEQA